MKQVMNYHKDNGLLNMIRRTDPMIVYRTNFFLRKYEKHTEGMPRGRGLAAPKSVCLLSISFR